MAEIMVSRSEYYRELGALGVKQRRRRELRSEYYRLMAYLRWRPELRAELLSRMSDIREAWLLLDEDIAYEREMLRRKVIAPPPPPRPTEEFIADEEVTGLDIYYHTEELVYKIRDPETKELVREEKELTVELTGSIETSVGHDVPIVLEITAITTISEMDAGNIAEITRREGPLESGLIEWLKSEGWEALARRLDTIDFAFMGKSIEPKRGYPCNAPDYSKVAVWMERRSRYVPERRYPTSGCSEYEAE